jgi:tyrosine aminotransferase
MRTSNIIRMLLGSGLQWNPEKSRIPLSIGDPTVFGNLKTHEEVIDATVDAVKSFKSNGYTDSSGSPTAREAIAERFSLPEVPLTAADIVITSGCSHSLDIATNALCSEGDNILLPRPGFPLYATQCDHAGIASKFYNLLPEKHWEVDLKHMDSLVDSRTRAILINNPSNPCGSVYSAEHLRDVLRIAEKHRLPVIADETYLDMVFPPKRFVPCASLGVKVPILSVSSLAKMWLVPGWRVGWICIQDLVGGSCLDEVRDAISRLTTIIVGANTIVQNAIPRIMKVPAKWHYDEVTKVIEKHSRLFFDAFKKIDGISMEMPEGAMYGMVKIDVERFKDIKDDLQFSQMLVKEESVHILPGSAFLVPNYCRIVTSVPEDRILEACERIAAFCKRHIK